METSGQHHYGTRTILLLGKIYSLNTKYSPLRYNSGGMLTLSDENYLKSSASV